MLKARPLCTSVRSNLRDRVSGEVGKNRFIALPGKRGHSGVPPLKTMCPNPGRFGEEFYSNGSRVGLLVRLGCVHGLHSFHLVSGNLLMSFSGSFNLVPGGHLWNEKCWHLPFVGGFSSINRSKILLRVSHQAEPGPCPKAALLFLGCSSLSLHPLPPSWLATVWILPLGLREGHGGHSLQGMGDRKGPCPGAPQGPARFQ